MNRRVLVIGSGGREHAIAWKLEQSPHVSQVIVCPGNAGMNPDWERWENAPYPELARRARTEKIDLVVIGPDQALADGAVDAFEAEGVACFGPSQKAAQLESSKAFAKDVMSFAQVPTAKFQVVYSREEARSFLENVEWGSGWVVKADGLALGKGVRVCETREEAFEAAHALFETSLQLVIEEKLSGEEISWLAFCDGERVALLQPARDYKRLQDGDQGPNTGGMGAFSPVPGVPDTWATRMESEVFLPMLREMKRRGIPFKGVLYAGVMAQPLQSKNGKFWILEFNARFGDPETQVLLPRMTDDLYDWCLAVARSDLRPLGNRVAFAPESAVYVVAAAEGYPENPRKGDVIEYPLGDAGYFFAGVSKGLTTSGGRVLGALGMGSSQALARQQAYDRLSKVKFSGMHFRKDIAR